MAGELSWDFQFVSLTSTSYDIIEIVHDALSPSR
jgi:hypothetical protein